MTTPKSDRDLIAEIAKQQKIDPELLLESSPPAPPEKPLTLAEEAAAHAKAIADFRIGQAELKISSAQMVQQLSESSAALNAATLRWKELAKRALKLAMLVDAKTLNEVGELPLLDALDEVLMRAERRQAIGRANPAEPHQ